MGAGPPSTPSAGWSRRASRRPPRQRPGEGPTARDGRPAAHPARGAHRHARSGVRGARGDRSGDRASWTRRPRCGLRPALAPPPLPEADPPLRGGRPARARPRGDGLPRHVRTRRPVPRCGRLPGAKRGPRSLQLHARALRRPGRRPGQHGPLAAPGRARRRDDREPAPSVRGGVSRAPRTPPREASAAGAASPRASARRCVQRPADGGGRAPGGRSRGRAGRDRGPPGGRLGPPLADVPARAPWRPRGGTLPEPALHHPCDGLGSGALTAQRGGPSAMGFRRGGFGAPLPEHRVPPERRGQTVRRTLGFFKPYRPRIAIVLLTILATSLLGLINPLLLKLLIDEALPERDFAKLNLFVGVMIAVPIVSGLIGVGQAYLNNAIGQSVIEDLRNALYAHLQRMPLRFFAETRTGEIQSRLSNDVGGI